MKVLNWVARRFLNNVQSCIAVLPDEDMEDDNMNSKYDVYEKERAMLEGWDYNFLAIGTLAIGPLETGSFEIIEKIEKINDPNHHNYLNYNNFENTEKNPLMNVTLFSHELDEESVAKTKTTQEQVINNYVVELDDNNNDIDNKDERQAMKRITLADILLEDSNDELVKLLAHNKQLNQANVLSEDTITMSKPSVKMIKPTFGAKRGLKLLKEDFSPMKKFNQLMKRMMKKKIHPDIQGETMHEVNLQSRPIVIGNPIINEDVGYNHF